MAVIETRKGSSVSLNGNKLNATKIKALIMRDIQRLDGEGKALFANLAMQSKVAMMIEGECFIKIKDFTPDVMEAMLLSPEKDVTITGTKSKRWKRRNPYQQDKIKTTRRKIMIGRLAGIDIKTGVVSVADAGIVHKNRIERAADHLRKHRN